MNSLIKIYCTLSHNLVKRTALKQNNLPKLLNHKIEKILSDSVNDIPERYLGDKAFWNGLWEIILREFKQYGVIIQYGYSDKSGRLIKIEHIKEPDSICSMVHFWNKAPIDFNVDMAFLVGGRELREPDFMLCYGDAYIYYGECQPLINEWEVEKKQLARIYDEHMKWSKAFPSELEYPLKFTEYIEKILSK